MVKYRLGPQEDSPRTGLCGTSALLPKQGTSNTKFSLSIQGFNPNLRSKMRDGAPGKIRTPDPQIRSLVLYPAELRVHCADGLRARQGGLVVAAAPKSKRRGGDFVA